MCVLGGPREGRPLASGFCLGQTRIRVNLRPLTPQRGRRWQAASFWFRGSHDSPIRITFQIGKRAVGVAFIHKTETPFAGRLCRSSLRYYAVSALSDYSVAIVTAGERHTDDRFIHSTFHKADKRSLRVVPVLTNKVHDLLVLIPALSWGHLNTAHPSTRVMLARSHLCQRSPRQAQILSHDLGLVEPIFVQSHAFHSYLCVWPHRLRYRWNI